MTSLPPLATRRPGRPRPGPPAVGPATNSAAPRRRARALTGEARWVWPALGLLLAATAVLYLWGLSASGWANQYYAAAAQAGASSWKAWLFGALDVNSYITVDKPPASLWVMGLSGRIFGVSSWSLLVPQALMGVASVGLLFAAVRRVSGAAAGLVAGAVLAVTPVATLMFRFDNPDALLTLLLVAGAYCMVRAIEAAQTRWLVLAGTAVGFAFLTKMMQAFLVLPAFALVYLVVAPTTLRRRILGVLAGGAALVVSAGWWIALVELWPSGSRPYIGGSKDGSVLSLITEYNGLDRLSGASGPGGGGGPGGTGFGGATGVLRMFGDAFGTQVSWLLPSALILMGAGLWWTRRAPRTDRVRAALLLWGGWLVVTGAVFSFMSGVIHPYYAVALAPAIGALVAIGGREAWRRREGAGARAVMAASVATAGAWASVLLMRTADWHPALRYVVVVATVAAAALVLLPPAMIRGRIAVAAMCTAGAVAMLGAPLAFSLQTASTAHAGSIPTAGPVAEGSDAMGGPGGMAAGGPGGGTMPAPPSGTGTGTMPFGAPPAGGTAPSSPSAPTGAGPGGQGGVPGGGMNADTELVALLEADTTHDWAAATVGSQAAAPLQLASGKAVLAIGGFNGGDPAPTLDEFTELVAQGRIGYFVASGGGMGAGPGGGGSGSEISQWVAANYTATTVGGSTVYDLSSPGGGG